MNGLGLAGNHKLKADGWRRRLAEIAMQFEAAG